MSSTAPGLDDALNRLVTILGGPPGGGSGPPSGAGGRSEPQPGGGTTSPPIIPQVLPREEFARLQMYLQGMPILTPEKIAEIEASLPELVATLETLGYRGSLKKRLADLMEAGKKGGERSASDDAALSNLVKALQNDLSAGGERIVPALALGLFMAAYTIAHQWGR